MDDDRLTIGSWLSMIYSAYGLDAAERLADELHGLSWNMKITHGDVERYLPRDLYYKWMDFDKEDD